MSTESSTWLVHGGLSLEGELIHIHLTTLTQALQASSIIHYFPNAHTHKIKRMVIELSYPTSLNPKPFITTHTHTFPFFQALIKLINLLINAKQ